MEEPDTSSAHDRLADSPGLFRTARVRGKSWLLVIAGLVLLAWLGQWAWSRWTHVYVDDARIDGEIVTLSSRVSGWITELPVIEGDVVKKGELLFRIDERDSRLQREVLAARLDTAENQMSVVRSRTGQVDQETQGKFQSETHRLKASQAEAAALDLQLKQSGEDYQRARELAA